MLLLVRIIHSHFNFLNVHLCDNCKFLYNIYPNADPCNFGAERFYLVHELFAIDQL